MRSALLPLTGWGAALIAIALLGRLAFGLQPLPSAVLAGAGLLAVAVGVGDRLRGSARRPDRAVRVSTSATLVAVGLVVALVCLIAFGVAVAGAGIAVAAIGGVGVLREGAGPA